MPKGQWGKEALERHLAKLRKDPRENREAWPKITCRMTKRFSHLSPELRERAEANLQRYLANPKNKAKLDAYQSNKRKYGGFYLFLCMVAIARAKWHGQWTGGMTPKQLNTAKRLKRSAKTRLGMTLSYRERKRLELDVQNVHPGHGKPVEAEVSSTNMEGV